jgi:hypothetical protein
VIYRNLFNKFKLVGREIGIGFTWFQSVETVRKREKDRKTERQIAR